MTRLEQLKNVMTSNHLHSIDVANILTFGARQTTINNVQSWLSIGQTRSISRNNLYILQLSCKIYKLSGKWP